MNADKIGIAPINWTNDDDPSLGGDISFEQCIREMAEAGYRGCELGNKFPRDVEQLQKYLVPLKLQVSSAWFSSYFTLENHTESTLSDFMHHLSLLKNLGAEYVTVCECGHATHGSNQPIFPQFEKKLNIKQWDNLIQGLHILGRLSHDYGLKLIYHHHLGTVIENKQQLDFLMQHTCPDLIGLLIDTGHAYAAGMELEQLLEEHGTRLEYVHLKDVRSDIMQGVAQQKSSFLQAVKAGLFTVPGDGVIDFSKFFLRLKQLNYEGWLVVEAEQDPVLANPKLYAIKARQTIKQYVGV